MAKNPRKRLPSSTPTPPGGEAPPRQLHGEETVAICRTNNTVPPLALRVNSLKASREEAIVALAKDGIAAEATLFSPDGITLVSPAAALRKSACYREGLIRIQDEASQLIARLVNPEPGERLLDLCAGSGERPCIWRADGKPREHHGLDLQSERLRMLAKRRDAGGDNRGDAGGRRRRTDRVLPGTFDRSSSTPLFGLGTLRRNPEIRWRLAPADLNRGMQLQKLLLTNAARCVRPVAASFTASARYAGGKRDRQRRFSETPS